MGLCSNAVETRGGTCFPGLSFRKEKKRWKDAFQPSLWQRQILLTELLIKPEDNEMSRLSYRLLL